MREKIYKYLEWLFYKKLCIRPDKKILGTFKITGWWYNFTGKIAYYFHRKTCKICK